MFLVYSWHQSIIRGREVTFRQLLHRKLSHSRYNWFPVTRRQRCKQLFVPSKNITYYMITRLHDFHIWQACAGVYAVHFLAIVDFNHLTFDLTNAWRSQRHINHVVWKHDDKEEGKTKKGGNVCFTVHQIWASIVLFSFKITMNFWLIIYWIRFLMISHFHTTPIRLVIEPDKVSFNPHFD